MNQNQLAWWEEATLALSMWLSLVLGSESVSVVRLPRARDAALKD